MKYFAIGISEDGDFSIDVFENPEELIRHFGLDKGDEEYSVPPSSMFKECVDCDEPGIMVIKGDVVMPKVEVIVKKWRLE